MLYNKQLFKHDPENGSIGDCQRTAIACILNLKPEEVEHFGEKHWLNSVEFNKAIHSWLEKRNLALVDIAYTYELKFLLEMQEQNNPNCYYMLCGTSGNNTNHVVVGKGSKIIWDPAIDNSGIIGPASCGNYWVSYLVPMEY